MFYNCGDICYVWEVFVCLHEVSVIFMTMEVHDIYVATTLAVASYHCIICILVMSIWIELGR